MNLNNLHQNAGRKYEKHLSIFGRKIFKVLVEQNTKDDFLNDRNQINRSSTRPYPYTEPSNFTYLNPDLPLSNSEKNVSDFINFDLSNEARGVQNTEDLTVKTTSFESPVLRKSSELVTSVYEDATPKIEHKNISSNSVNNDIAGVPPASSLLSSHSTTVHDAEAVPWEDMFDFNSSQNDPRHDYVTAPDLIDAGLLDKTSGNKSNRHGNRISKIRFKKRPTDIEFLLPKKIKKTPEEGKEVKPTFRKQKYSKSVKIWLNDVDAAHPVDDADDTNRGRAGPLQSGVTNAKDNSLKIPGGNIAKEGESKRKVQAQLTNQNGIMKYCKPKNLSETSNVGSGGSATASSSNRETRATPQTWQLIPPIHSQNPVKELTHEIATFQNEPSNDNLNLFEYSAEEIVITLMYRDGSCQLNRHSAAAAEAGGARGVMLLAKHKYYLIANTLTDYKESIETLINRNSCVCYEGKNVIIHLVNQFGISIDTCNAKFLDVKVGGSLLDPDNPPSDFSELQKVTGYVAELAAGTRSGAQETARQLALLRGCWQRLQRRLLAQGLWKVFVDIEMRVLPIIANMERLGVRVNVDKLRDMELLLLERLRAVEQACHRAAGRAFPLTSPPQLRAVLYDELRLDSHCGVQIRETVSQGAKSTCESTLRSLMNRHPLPKLILEHRHLHKAYSTFVLGIAQRVRRAAVAPVWEQSAAATGRIACRRPNLQAVPRAPLPLTLFPEDGSEVETLNLRSLYESRAGWQLVAADFRQMECRVLALAAGDAALLAALRSPDLFTLLAASWLGKAEAAVSGEERERTKRVVYASMYGAGADKLADVLGLGYERALEVIASFNRTFPSLKSFARRVRERCARDGSLRTPCGRVRRFEDIASPNAAARAQAERKAINFLIQGSAADACKVAMVSSVAALAEHSPPLRARLLLQIHDELVWEVRDEELHAAAVIQAAMEGCGRSCGLPAPLPVALRRGRNWAHMEDFNPHAD